MLRIRRRILAPLQPVTGVLALVVAGGCAASSPEGPVLREVSLAEFSRPRPTSPDATRTIDGDPSPDTPFAPRTVRSEQGEPMIGPGRPIPLMASSLPAISVVATPGEPVIIDRMVGQINGRPVYADAFFREIDDLLRAKSEELPREQFMQEAAEIVVEQLRAEVLNALFLAEAESQLTAPQQQGLLGWMGQIRERIIAGNRGSSILASERIESEQEMSLDELVSEYKDQTLIKQLLRQKVLPRVIVSWRDIEREYARRADEFNPHPRVVLARIRLNTKRDAGLILEIEDRLESGEPFDEVAMSVGQWDDGQWQSFALGPDGVAGIELNEVMKARLEILEPGQTTERFELGTSTWWIHVTEIESPAGRSLYDPDVQRRLEAEIRGRRMEEERARYIRTLLEKGIYDELQAMATQLIDIAIARHAPPE